MELKKVFLILGIAITCVLFFAYALHVFYPEPENDCYKSTPDIPEKVSDNATQEEKDDWEKEQRRVQQNTQECREEFEIERDQYGFIGFIILAFIAVVLIVVSMVFIGYDSIGTGLLGGGIILLIYAILRFWGDINQLIRLIVMAIALGALIYIGHKYVDNKTPGKK